MGAQKLTKGELTRKLEKLQAQVQRNKLSAQAFKESEEKFRTIFESFQDIYFRCDIKGNITMVSPSIFELIGYKPEKVIGKNITNYYLYTSKTKDLIRQLVRNHSVKNFEAAIITKSGEIIQCICNVRLLYNQKGGVKQIEGIARDITQLQKAHFELMKSKEIAERSLKVKDLFLANMSHEIRTPMNGVIGMIDLLRASGLKAEQTEYVEKIKKSSETLMAILNDILDLSKIEAGKMKLRKSAIHLADTLEKLDFLFSHQAEASDIQLHYEIGTDIPEFIKIDETRILQIFSNLLSNGIKFTGKNGKIDILITRVKTTSRLTSKKIKLRAEVRDTGIGIKDTNQSMLFENFSQVDSSASKPYSGTGLGLSIARELTTLMKGEIGVQSELGLGSTFWFTFEVEEVKPSEVIREQDADHEVISDRSYGNKQPYLLLVDDNQINLQVATEILRRSGCRVDTSSNGPDAIDLAEKNPYDLIFMDIQMPDMDGVTATKKIKSLGLKHPPPIVAMTAYSMREDKEKFLAQGLDGYLAKPIKAQDLIGKVQKWVTPEQSTYADNPEESQTNGKVINREVLEQLRKFGGEEMVVSALSDFETETEEELASCEHSAQVKNYTEIMRKLHTIKGNAGILGVDQLADEARSLELKLKDEDYSSLGRDLKSLRNRFTDFQKHLSSYLNPNG